MAENHTGRTGQRALTLRVSQINRGTPMRTGIRQTYAEPLEADFKDIEIKTGKE